MNMSFDLATIPSGKYWTRYLVLFLSILVSCDFSDNQQNLEIAETALVTIDTNTSFQTVQGFGVFGAEKVWRAEEPFFSPEFVDMLINDLGVTVLRDNVPIAFEPENDNEDPDNLDLSAFNLSTDYPGADSHLGQHLPYLKALDDAGLEKLIVTIWSPPLWMKHNDHRGNGSDAAERKTSAPGYLENPDKTTNQLQADLYEEFAEYCVAYIRILKQETGIDLYAISLQNEPRFSQFYASAVHSPESLRDLIKIVGTRFEKENISTKIFMPEDVQSLPAISRYVTAILEDPDANRHTDIIAIHNYRGDGVQPSDSAPESWLETARLAAIGNKEVWMTETSGFDAETMNGGMALAKSMYNALNYGQVSAWVYWQISGRDLIDQDRGKTPLYFVSKQFYRHIRPGSIRIKIESSDEAILPLAFKHPETGEMTLVIINDGATNRTIDIAGVDTQERHNHILYLTSDSHQHEKMAGPISLGQDTISIPAKSLVTLVPDIL